MAPRNIHVGMGEGAVTSTPHVVLAPGIGSCVVVTLYHDERRVGGLAHVMLPDSACVHGPLGSFQCADTAVTALLAGLREWGALPRHLVAKMIGGARMFSSYENGSPGIGRQNIQSIKEILAWEGIPLVGWDVAGRHGRSVAFHLASGRLVVKALGAKDREF